MKGLEAKIFGMENNRDKRRISFVPYKRVFRKVLQNFGINKQSKPVSTPLFPHFKLNSMMLPNTNTEREYVSIYKCCRLLDVCNYVYEA